MNRLGLKVSCFVISVVIWVQVASTSLVEQSTDLPLSVAGLSEQYTIAGSEIPREASVKVQGSKLKLLAHKYFNYYIGEIRVNLADRTPGPAFSYELDQADVFTDLAVISIYPPVRLRLRVDRQVVRRLPLELVAMGELPDDVGYLAPLEVDPDSVLVSGPERYFEDLTGVQLEPIDQSDINSSRTVELDVIPPHEQLQIVPEEASLLCLVAQLEDRTLANIPVVPLVDAGQPEVGVSPPVADVMVRGVADSIRTLTEARFSVTVPVGNLAEGLYVLPGQVDYPSWLTVMGLDPPEFQVIVGQPPVDEGLAEAADEVGSGG